MPKLPPGEFERRQKLYQQKRREMFKAGPVTSAENYLAVRTYREVGNILGISKERVRQIERMAIHKIRKALAADWAEFKEQSSESV